MPSLTRSELAAYAACTLLIGLLGWRALRADHDASASVSATPPARTAAAKPTAEAGAVSVGEAAPTSAVVHVVGAVRRPGVYRLPAGARVQDAIRRAGGARRGADLQAINLAAKITDAQQVAVPRQGRAAALSGTAAAGEAGAAGAGAGALVNLNSATAEQLDTLDGVGPATAQKILEYRQAHGGFRTIDDLAQISGIGPKRLEALRGRVTV